MQNVETGAEVTEEAILRAMSGEQRGQIWELDPEQDYLIGRSRSCPVKLEDPTASARHARVERRGPVWFVVDLGSTHGTRVNRQRILNPKPLFDRDVIWIGKTLLQFREYESLDESDLAEIERGVQDLGKEPETPPAEEELERELEALERDVGASEPESGEDG